VNLLHLYTSLGVLVAAALSAAATPSAEETHGFARYQIILDRSPFGPVPGSANPAAAAQPGFSQRLTLVGIVQSNGQDGVVQAIIDDKTGHRTYFKTEGEAIDDVKVLHIEIKPPQSVVVQRGLETATLTFPEPSATAAQPPGARPPQPGSAMQSEPNAPPPVGIRRIPFRRGN
jgi:hypothetical protein